MEASESEKDRQTRGRTRTRARARTRTRKGAERTVWQSNLRGRRRNEAPAAVLPACRQKPLLIRAGAKQLDRSIWRTFLWLSCLCGLVCAQQFGSAGETVAR